ncbi:hypothetical protein [Streptomyces roseifaciens]|uniref:hypothetical protein n=1 Tax=Streptomyces roseifaciens TaxID=1488406 RepID=UPI000717EF0B|nr:hypothetical protein [Streptomyces roseifaciens]
MGHHQPGDHRQEPRGRPAQPGPVQLHKPPAPATPPVDLLTDAWGAPAVTPTASPAPTPAAADAWSLAPAPPDDPAESSTAASPADPTAVDDDQAVGLR